MPERVQLSRRMMTCAVCQVRLYVTREPRAFVCQVCGKNVCPRHANFYADESNRAITASARPKCPECWDGKP